MRHLTEELSNRLDKLAEEGNAFCDAEQNSEALKVWKSALELIPEPKHFYSESMWFFTSVGYLYFVGGQYDKALIHLEKARDNLSGKGYSNPFVMMVLGEIYFELGNETYAEEYLLRAYMLDGLVFEEEPPKYLEFLKSRVDLTDEDGGE